jgi:thiosulfate/3-mercaptopyruvate sulfurtransferase
MMFMSLVLTAWFLAPWQVQPMVTSAWLADHLTDPKVVVLHVGNARDYAVHVPGARLVSLGDVSVSDRSETGLNLQMLPPDELKAALEAFGISDDSHVVVYPAQNAVQSATRVVLTLAYAGLGERTSMLDGGLTGWVREGRPTTPDAPAVRPGMLKSLSIQPLVVDSAFVRSHVGQEGFRVVDARTRAFYEGASTGGSTAQPHKTGHIEGAVNVPYDELTDGASQFKTLEELRAIFDAAGVKAGETVVAYCHLGQQATAAILAARLLGHPVLLYDGSFEEWSRLPNAPVATGKNK